MNLQENICLQAKMNGSKCGPKRLEDMNLEIPYIHVSRGQDGKWDVKGFNYEAHDNAPRMALYIHYLKYGIFPNVSDNISGYYNMELHDSYTYLDKPYKYKDVLTFSKFKDDAEPILLPDPYMVVNWGNQSVHDNTPWRNKDDKVCFYGTTTGDRNPFNNRRINMCLWSLGQEREKIFDFKVTKVAQMAEVDIVKQVGVNKWRQIYRRDPVSIEEQLTHKFQFLPDGNTCKFDTWYFKTNTLNFKDKSREMLWYHPMFMNKDHFVEVNEHNIESNRMYYLNNWGDAERIMINANNMARDLFKPTNHMYYTTLLFETMASNGK
jgi:hypothetical protein